MSSSLLNLSALNKFVGIILRVFVKSIRSATLSIFFISFSLTSIFLFLARENFWILSANHEYSSVSSSRIGVGFLSCFRDSKNSLKSEEESRGVSESWKNKRDRVFFA